MLSTRLPSVVYACFTAFVAPIAIALCHVPLHAPDEPPTTAPSTMGARPKALLALEAYREAQIRRGYFEWTLRDMQKDRVSHSTSRFANGDQIYTWRGDDAGIVGHNRGTGELIVGEFRQLLRRNGEHWYGTHESLEFRLEPSGTRKLPFGDIRTIDLEMSAGKDLHAALWEPLIKSAPVRYEERNEKGLHHVTRFQKVRNRDVQQHWWLDPERGFAPVRMQIYSEGRVLREQRATYRQYDGVWFPQTVLEFNGAAKDGRKPTKTITINTARFGGDLPEKLEPSDIGVEAGSVVYITEPFQSKWWDGAKLVTHEQFREGYKSGKIKLGPTVLRTHQEIDARNAAEPAGHLQPPDIVDIILKGFFHDWEQYVIRFKETNRLDEAQRASAQAVEKDCKDRARRYVLDKRSEFENLHGQETRTTMDAEGKTSIVISKDIRDRRRSLEQPLHEIFDTQLKPRLDGLLTTPQEKAKPTE